MMKPYAEKGKKIHTSTIEKAILKSIAGMKGKSYCRKDYQNLKDVTDVQHWASSLKGLNDALMDGRDVFAVCEKSPRGNLDSGSHHYTICYVGRDYHVHRLWLGYFAPALGARTNNASTGLLKWTWASGTIGMSRVLAATDRVFDFLKRIGGCYAQIDVI